MDSHKNCVYDMDSFIKASRNSNQSINVIINKLDVEQIRKNRIRILPIIACIEFLGKNNIALRGHCDDSTHYLNEQEGMFGIYINYLILIHLFHSIKAPFIYAVVREVCPNFGVVLKARNIRVYCNFMTLNESILLTF